MVCAALLFFGDGPRFTLWANSHHHIFADRLFGTLSVLAEWPLIAIAIGWAIAKNPRIGLWFALCFLLEFIINQGLKSGIGATRPVVQFGNLLREVEGHPLAHFRAFPSGHTAAAFTALGFLAIQINRKAITCILLLLSTLCAYSRLYLAQHYLVDIAGGICIALLILIIFQLGLSKFAPAKTGGS
jgi:membrane-associated phospholipid phosphatase